jgi:hypothetical protein
MKTDLTAGLELLHTKLTQRRKPVLMPTVHDGAEGLNIGCHLWSTLVR